MRPFMRKLFCLFMAVFTAAALCAVSVSAASVKLSRSSVDLPIGYSITLKVSGTDKNVSWSVGDSSVAYIKSSGGNSAKIVGKKTGSTTVYAKANGVDLKCSVTVKKSFISVSEDSVALDKGQSRKLTLTVNGSKDIALSNSDKSVCSAVWGKWNGNKITVTVKALKSGNSDITFYAKNNMSSTSKTVSVSAGKPDAVSASETEEVIELVNKERAERGLPPLESDSVLNNIAAQRASEIVKKFSHDRPDRTSCFELMEEYGIINVWSGENIACGQKTPEEVMESWMNSKGHRENILGENFTKIGVGVYKTDNIYKYYWVQVFASDY